jgi:hypothetical protein
VDIELVALGSSFIDEQTGETRWQASQSADDRRQIPDAVVFGSLGVSSQPYGPTNTDDFCEGILLTQIGGYMGYVIGARDARSTRAIGNLSPGDTCLHATGPKSHAKVLLKEKKSVAAVMTTDKRGKNMVISLEGEDERLTIAALGYAIQITRDGGIAMSSRNGQHGITISDQGVHVRGNVVLGGSVPLPGMALMMGPQSGQPAGGAVVLMPAMGVTVGA